MESTRNESTKKNTAEEEKTFTKSQKRLGEDKNVKKIINYLEDLLKKHGSLSHLFAGTGRVFINKETTAKFDSKQIHTVFDEESTKAFEIKYKDWQPKTIDGNALQELKSNFTDFFLNPVENNPAWQKFWQEQTTSMPEDEKHKLRDQIASAMVFKIQSNWIESKGKDPSSPEEIAKLALLTKLSNAIWNGELNAIITDLKNMVNTKLISQIIANPNDFENNHIPGSFVMDIIKGKTQIKDVTTDLQRRIDQIRNNIYFKSLDEEAGEKILDDMGKRILVEIDKASYHDKQAEKTIPSDQKEKIKAAVRLAIPSLPQLIHTTKVKSNLNLFAQDKEKDKLSSPKGERKGVQEFKKS